MREEGKVISVTGDVAEVALPRSRMCGGCATACSCADDDTMVTQAAAIPGLEPGDRVMVEIELPSPTLGAIFAFLLPVAGLLAGIIVGRYWHPGGLSADAASAIFGFTLLAATFAGAVWVNRAVTEQRDVRPRIVGKVD